MRILDDPALREDAVRQRRAARACTRRPRSPPAMPTTRASRSTPPTGSLREMQSAAGGFYSSLDADSEGHEGKFYVWSREEVRAALSADEYAACSRRATGSTAPPTSRAAGTCYVAMPLEELARTSWPAHRARSRRCSRPRARKLLAVRAQRVRPARDDKILTSWNALMIRGLAIAARALEREELADWPRRGRSTSSAARCGATGGCSPPTWTARAHLNAYLDDYVYPDRRDPRAAAGALPRRRARLRAASSLEVVLAHFEDQQAGGFFFTSDDHEALIHRSKSFGDDATPVRQRHRRARPATPGSPARGAALPRRRRAHAARRVAGDEPLSAGHTSLLTALEELLNPPQIVILRGEAAAIDVWRRELAHAVRAAAPGAGDSRRRARPACRARGEGAAGRGGRLRVPRERVLGAACLARGARRRAQRAGGPLRPPGKP